MTSRKQSTKKAKKRTSQIRNNELLDYLKKKEEMGSMNKMINSNPKGGRRSMSDRYTASTGGRVPYNKGGSTQPEYKSGDMPKCMPK
tara:strand:- start:172 stop:432 length:261 start_codon:yes stop_codon:yes gene_type:complete